MAGAAALCAPAEKATTAATICAPCVCLLPNGGLCVLQIGLLLNGVLFVLQIVDALERAEGKQAEAMERRAENAMREHGDDRCLDFSQLDEARQDELIKEVVDEVVAVEVEGTKPKPQGWLTFKEELTTAGLDPYKPLMPLQVAAPLASPSQGTSTAPAGPCQCAGLASALCTTHALGSASSPPLSI